MPELSGIRYFSPHGLQDQTSKPKSTMLYPTLALSPLFTVLLALLNIAYASPVPQRSRGGRISTGGSRRIPKVRGGGFGDDDEQQQQENQGGRKVPGWAIAVIVVGVFLVLLLVVLVGFIVYKKKRAARERERERIAAKTGPALAGGAGGEKVVHG